MFNELSQVCGGEARRRNEVPSPLLADVHGQVIAAEPHDGPGLVRSPHEGVADGPLDVARLRRENELLEDRRESRLNVLRSRMQM